MGTNLQWCIPHIDLVNKMLKILIPIKQSTSYHCIEINTLNFHSKNQNVRLEIMLTLCVGTIKHVGSTLYGNENCETGEMSK